MSCDFCCSLNFLNKGLLFNVGPNRSTLRIFQGPVPQLSQKSKDILGSKSLVEAKNDKVEEEQYYLGLVYPVSGTDDKVIEVMADISYCPMCGNKLFPSLIVQYNMHLRRLEQLVDELETREGGIQ